MTDTPIDQKALAARLIDGANKIDGHMAGVGLGLDMGPIETAMREAAAALSRRVSASGELEPVAMIDLSTLKWWRELVDLNPADLAPRLDDRIRALSTPPGAPHE